jgi:hypothetical protein
LDDDFPTIDSFDLRLKSIWLDMQPLLTSSPLSEFDQAATVIQSVPHEWAARLDRPFAAGGDQGNFSGHLLFLNKWGLEYRVCQSSAPLEFVGSA